MLLALPFSIVLHTFYTGLSRTMVTLNNNGDAEDDGDGENQWMNMVKCWA